MAIKTCQNCPEPRYYNSSLCKKHYYEHQKALKKEKGEKKKTKHQLTKKYQEQIIKKLIHKADRLYQEWGRIAYKTSIFGTEYNCLHHFIRKSQSLATRYDTENGIPISLKEHCSIHQGQNSEIEGKIVLIKGREWFNGLIEKKHTIITNKLEFLNKGIKKLEDLIYELQ